MRAGADATPVNARMELRAYAANHQSEVVDREHRRRADLIYVNYRGARLRIPDWERSRAWKEGHALMLNLGIACAQGITENVSCLVRWVQGDDLGVDFTRPLPVGVSDLQGWLEQ
ncbi:MAG: hypothetical protein AB1916_15065 [Thermodesulfobacteriota bacterium]